MLHIACYIWWFTIYMWHINFYKLNVTCYGLHVYSWNVKHYLLYVTHYSLESTYYSLYVTYYIISKKINKNIYMFILPVNIKPDANNFHKIQILDKCINFKHFRKCKWSLDVRLIIYESKKTYRKMVIMTFNL